MKEHVLPAWLVELSKITKAEGEELHQKKLLQKLGTIETGGFVKEK